MRNLPPFTNAFIALSMYNATFNLSIIILFLNLLIEVVMTHVPVHLKILVQDDGLACLIDTCWVKDPDPALIPQFLTVHGLHPTYKDRTKKIY
jgi:hypothetical protein